MGSCCCCVSTWVQCWAWFAGVRFVCCRCNVSICLAVSTYPTVFAFISGRGPIRGYPEESLCMMKGAALAAKRRRCLVGARQRGGEGGGGRETNTQERGERPRQREERERQTSIVVMGKIQATTELLKEEMEMDFPPVAAVLRMPYPPPQHSISEHSRRNNLFQTLSFSARHTIVYTALHDDVSLCLPPNPLYTHTPCPSLAYVWYVRRRARPWATPPPSAPTRPAP